MCALLENMSIQYRVFENIPLHIVCSVRVCARVCVSVHVCFVYLTVRRQ